MQKLVAFIGAVVGAFLGWGVGRVADGLSAVVTETAGGNRYAWLGAVVGALAWGFAFWRLSGRLVAEQKAAVERVERAEAASERTRIRSGKTPPTASPAFG